MSVMEAGQAAQGDYASRVRENNMHPLWLRTDAFQHFEPAPEEAAHWAWDKTLAFADEAIAQTNMKQAERRVLLLANPAYPGQSKTTPTLQGAIQVLAPGESARPHRHTPGALRFILDDGGETYSVVDGKECKMQKGDIVMTPSYCWHGHFHKGSKRSIWFDALDAPLMRYLDATFHEPWKEDSVNPLTVNENDFTAVGLSPVVPEEMSAGASPRFLYPWAQTLAALRAATPREDGSAWLRLTNPTGGRTALQLIDCMVIRVTGTATRGERSTASKICVVGAGSGRTVLGERTLHWSAGDIFTIPHWQWASHQANPGPDGEEAILFTVSDKAALDRLGLSREERR